MVSSELTTTAFCARCGRRLVGGVCPNLCNGHMNGSVTGPPRPPVRGPVPAPGRSRIASALVVAAALVATAVAGTAFGNSGGPVIDQHGRVIGVAVAKVIGGGAEGLSFAVPSSRLCIALSVC